MRRVASVRACHVVAVDDDDDDDEYCSYENLSLSLSFSLSLSLSLYRKSTRLNSSHTVLSRMPSSA